MLSHFFRHDHEDAPQHQTYYNGHRSEEGIFDEIMENETHEASREHGNRQVQKRRPPFPEPVMGIQNENKFLPIHHQNGKNRAQLDKYVKQIGQYTFEAQHMTHNNHMTCGGHRNVLGQAFYYTYNKRTKIFVHHTTSKIIHCSPMDIISDYASFLCCGFSATAMLSTFLSFK